MQAVAWLGLAWLSDHEDAAAAYAGLTSLAYCGIIALAQTIPKWRQLQSAVQLKVQAHMSKLPFKGRSAFGKPNRNEDAMYSQAGSLFAHVWPGHRESTHSASSFQRVSWSWFC